MSTVRCSTYWYVPKARTLSGENVEACARTLRLIFDEFLGEPWDQETQSAILTRLIEEGVHESQDKVPARRTAWRYADHQGTTGDAGAAVGRH